MRSKWFAGFLAVAVLLGLVALAAEKRERPDPKTLLGQAAADFELQTADGGKFKLSDHKDKDIVVLDFWATWCPPCQRSLPVLVEVTGSFKDKNVVFCAVNLRETAEKVRKFQDERKLQFASPLDKDGAVAGKYLVSGIPQSVIVGKDGTVQAVHVGASPDLKDKLTGELQALVDGKKLAEPPKEEKKD